MVGQIRAVAKPKAMRSALAVCHTNGMKCDAGRADWLIFKKMRAQPGTARLRWLAVEDVLKSTLDGVKGFGRTIDRDFLLLQKVEWPYVIEAENVVGVGMGVEDSVQPLNAEVQCLIAEIRRSID